MLLADVKVVEEEFAVGLPGSEGLLFGLAFGVLGLQRFVGLLEFLLVLGFLDVLLVGLGALRVDRLVGVTDDLLIGLLGLGGWLVVVCFAGKF